MNNLEEKLLRVGVHIAPGGYITPNYDFAKHIRNSIYGFLCQGVNTSSFIDYFIREKKLYFKDNKAILKRFFNGLLYYIERLDDPFKKDFYAYILNNDINRQTLKDTYNILHKLRHDDKLEVELQKFYKIDSFTSILKTYVRLNELEADELLDKVSQNSVYKQYLPISFVELAILEIYIYRQKRYTDVLIAKVNWRVAKKSIYYTNKTESIIDTKTKYNIFDANAGRLYKKGFSCFRFDFMPTKKVVKKVGKSPVKVMAQNVSRSPVIQVGNKVELRNTETINAFLAHKQILSTMK